jgi:hypothetical protein
VGGVLIVGEQPNGSVGPDGPLSGASAARLAALAYVDVSVVLAHRRVNLLAHGAPWDVLEARLEAKRLDVDGPPVSFLLLGRRVATAFGLGRVRTFTEIRLDSGRPVTLVPHPSGRCRVWNDTGSRATARAMLGPLLGGGR